MQTEANSIVDLSRRSIVGVSALAAAAFTVSVSPATSRTKSQKVVKNFGVPWEDAYGYAQAVQVGATIHISGQLSHNNKGEMVAPAPVDEGGKVTDFSNMGAQMEQSYANCAKVLAAYGLTLDSVVQETIYVLDMDAAFKVAGPVRKTAFGSPQPAVASTILVTPRLAFPSQLIEISMVAVTD
ncbi:Rid family hydrolase [Rhizobium sp. BK060]|uniref:RidA family protein n=1 Tax=Rhizobium sp. BK060 TaxID=2587096 RepID=UPI00161E16E5|nr:Rid family hydrolase [Rhizobium sp. BK060]MBB3397292.1 enamine deaminase RidA (YjgF/YER057c/UK114 family) [Rhizobium sp. BK060]